MDNTVLSNLSLVELRLHLGLRVLGFELLDRLFLGYEYGFDVLTRHVPKAEGQSNHLLEGKADRGTVLVHKRRPQV